MIYESIRKQVVEAVLEAAEQKLIHGTSGNIAMRDSEKRNIVAITPSGIPYNGMTAEEIAVVEMKEDGTNEWIDGPYKPSSELPMHTAVLRARADVNATVHTHSMFATIMAMGDEAGLLAITPPHCEFTPVGIVPFVMPGSDDIAARVLEAIGERGRTCLLKNHGMFSCGIDMTAAMHAAVYTEEMAQTTYYAKLLGIFEPMPEEAERRMKEFLTVGRSV